MAEQRYLDEKLDCPSCGRITLDIPADASEDTIITCSSCGIVIGKWGELQDSFSRQAGEGVFDVNHGRFKRR
jgi:predicted RNA-binding Zn-ribbon protein involved in translation (DUF1610 family)